MMMVLKSNSMSEPIKATVLEIRAGAKSKGDFWQWMTRFGILVGIVAGINAISNGEIYDSAKSWVQTFIESSEAEDIPHNETQRENQDKRWQKPPKEV